MIIFPQSIVDDIIYMHYNYLSNLINASSARGIFFLFFVGMEEKYFFFGDDSIVNDNIMCVH